MQDKSIKEHFEEWSFNSNFTARNMRLEQRYVQRYDMEVVGGFFAGWKERAKIQVQQALAVERLVMRVDCRLLENILDRWNVNVHNEIMYVQHCNRVITRGILILVRDYAENGRALVLAADLLYGPQRGLGYVVHSRI